MGNFGLPECDRTLVAAEATTDSAQNQLLSALSPADREHLLSNLEPVTFSFGQVICAPGRSIGSGYFLTDSVVSLLYTMESGSTAEIGLVGNDGVVGIPIFLGGESTCSWAVVAVSGQGLAIPANVLRKEFSQRLGFQNILLRYTQALLTQVSQNAVCNRLHSIEQRLCRWLLLCQRRTNRLELLMTQELIAQMLGTRRESVTVAAGHLQDLGLIHYCRGHIRVLNLSGLEASACECYRVIEEERNRLFGRKGPGRSGKHGNLSKKSAEQSS
jgi:CRP-like cAMP-binding protein